MRKRLLQILSDGYETWKYNQVYLIEIPVVLNWSGAAVKDDGSRKGILGSCNY